MLPSTLHPRQVFVALCMMTQKWWLGLTAILHGKPTLRQSVGLRLVLRPPEGRLHSLAQLKLEMEL